MAKNKIRTRKRPYEVIEVEGPELLSLTRQGLVLEVVEAAHVPAAAPAPAAPVVEDETPPLPPRRPRKLNDGGK